LKDLDETFAALLMAFMGVDASDEVYAAAEADRRSNRMHQGMTMSHRD
jgi:hypothetical protein